ncbi:MAG: hypothetical protein J6T11_01505 [Bacteroidaceae bacterium]|nr:hypothetical protein [Bacteroidaceae bacterium]
MKKFNLLIAAGLFASVSMQAQTVIASLGFEENDPKGKSTNWAITPDKSIFGDWVNVKDQEFMDNEANKVDSYDAVDVWNEQYSEEVHSGSFALQAVNTDGYVYLHDADNDHPEPYLTDYVFQAWDRGFKIAQLPIQEDKSYRVTFWIKGDQGSKLSSWLSKGVENYDKSVCTGSGQNYGLDQVTLTGDWQHMSFIAYVNSDKMNEYVNARETWRGDSKIPESLGGDGTKKYREQFNNELPNEFFFIANMFTPGATYILDDIKIEENVAFNKATFNYYDSKTDAGENVIKLDFGYMTNVATLAKASVGGELFMIDPSCMSVTVDGAAATIKYVEGHDDGFIYVFLDEEVDMNKDSKVVISYTPATDVAILYEGDKRPSADYESEMKVLGFTNESAYFDPEIDVISNEWLAPKVVSTNPENESFEIDGATFKKISVTFDKEVTIDYAAAGLELNHQMTALPYDAITVAEDGKTVDVAVSDLEDGEYTFILSEVGNAMGITIQDPVQFTFSVGKDDDTSVAETVYASDFDNATANGLPKGWVLQNAAGMRKYDYDNPSQTYGTGCRVFDGFSGAFSRALYWGSRETEEGWIEFGGLMSDFVDANGDLLPEYVNEQGEMVEVPEGITLKLDARKYNVKFLMAAWKGEPKFTFRIMDLNGNEVPGTKSDVVTAAPNAGGARGAIDKTKVVIFETDFVAPKAGYYKMRFDSEPAQWQEFLLANVQIITMPSKAAFWKGELKKALEPAQKVLEDVADRRYNGESKTALFNVVKEAEAGGFTSPSAIQAEIEKLQAAADKMQQRKDNYDLFENSLQTLQDAYLGLANEGEEKYLNSDIAKEAKGLLDQYGETDPATLTDENLLDVAPHLGAVASQLPNVKGIVDILTWRAYKAGQTADKLGVAGSQRDALDVLPTDDTEAIDAVNALSTIQLYKALAENINLLKEDETLKTTVNYSNDQWVVEDGEYVAKTEEDVATSGIDFTCLVNNPKMYTYSTTNKIENNTIVGWSIEDGARNIQFANGSAATKEKPVIESLLNGTTAGGEYDFYQVIENAPVGVYDVYIGTRTASQVYQEEFVPYNGMNDETGVWDKYIYAQVDDGERIMTPFAIASGWAGFPCVIPNVEVKEGSILRIGVVEHMVSGKAKKDGQERTVWDTNTFFTDARMYFVAPLEGYDYAKAAQEMETSIEDIEAAADAKNTDAIYNLAGQLVDENYKGVVIINGKKVLMK